MIRHVNSSYKTGLLFIDSKLKAVIRTKVHLGKLKNADAQMRTNSIISQPI